jgi:hypothetical protein
VTTGVGIGEDATVARVAADLTQSAGFQEPVGNLGLREGGPDPCAGWICERLLVFGVETSRILHRWKVADRRSANRIGSPSRSYARTQTRRSGDPRNTRSFVLGFSSGRTAPPLCKMGVRQDIWSRRPSGVRCGHFSGGLDGGSVARRTSARSHSRHA